MSAPSVRFSNIRLTGCRRWK